MNSMHADHCELDISVVTFNSSRWVDVFFTSLLHQDFPLDRIHVLIRDNGSTDDTLACCHAIKQQLTGRFGSVTVGCGENIGFGAGHNANLAISRSGYFLVTNVDLEFAGDAISTAVTVASQDAAETASWEFRQQPYEHPKLYHPATLETEWSSSACILFRRTALERVGGYDERIFLYGEDVDLSYRLRDRGYRLKYCPQAVCRHYSYEHAGQIKPQQFFGSTLANFFIRLRFGSLWDVVYGAAQYLTLWFVHPRVSGWWRCLLRNGVRMIADAPYFLRSRKLSSTRFTICGWDYSVLRDGAFYSKPAGDSMGYHLVSVIVRTYAGRLPWLREAVASISNQTYSRIELVVVEDGSSEAREFIAELERSAVLERVVYQSLAKLGRCHAGNCGLKLATGDYLSFLDDDDLFFADHLETLVSELSAHPEYELAYSIGIVAATELLSHSPFTYRTIAYSVQHRQPFSRPVLWHHNYIPIQTALFSRRLFERHGGLDEEMDNLEDWNMWTRYSMDSTFLFVEKATSIYRVPAVMSADVSRQRLLDNYYQVAVEKQREMRVCISPYEILGLFDEFSRNQYVIAVSHSAIRKLLVSFPLLRPLLWPARIISMLIRHWRLSKKKTAGKNT